MPLGEIVDERSLVNSIVALHATGGSTNHTLHMRRSPRRPVSS